MENWIKRKLAILMGTWFSLDRKFRKNKATAEICFIGEDRLGSSIRLKLGGMEYFFEGTPMIEEYKNAQGDNVLKKKLKYGGWGVDLTAPENKIF